MTQADLQTGWRRRHDGRWREKVAGIVLSLVFHGGLVAVAGVSLLLSAQEPDEEPHEVVFDEVDLLALGEEVDPDALPKLTGDEGAPAPVEEVAPEAEEPEPVAEPEPEPEPEEGVEPDPEAIEEESPEDDAESDEERRRREDEERRRQMDEALGEFEASGRTDDAPEGSPMGVEGGTASDADEADMVQTYHARLLQEIERRWEVPATLSDSQLKDLAGQVRVFVQLDDDGHIRSYEIREHSENDQFDASIERVLRQFQADDGGEVLPMPEQEQIRREIIHRGLMLTNWETLDRG